MVEVIIQYFRVKRKKDDKNYDLLCKRQKEYTHCLKKNLEYNAIQKIHILLENDDDFEELKSEGIDITNEKINIVHFNKRMNYKEAFEYANTQLKDKIVVIPHADIYLEGGFEKIIKENLKNKMYALARTNNVNGKNTGRGICIKKIPNKTGNYCCTFDGWCFLSPIPKEILQYLNYPQNSWGGENKLIYVFKTNNYNVITPNSLKLVHWHMTDIRPWDIKKQWITKEGNFVSHEKRHLFQTHDKVGGGIPIELGTSEMVNV